VAAIRESIEVARRPEEVFTYLYDLSRHGEWQERVVSVRVHGAGPTAVGSRATETRRICGRNHRLTYTITEHNSPWGFGFRGVDGPVRPFGKRTIEPLDGGSRSRVTLELDFQGHGLGRLLLPFVRSHARKQVPKGERRLKERLEDAPTETAASGRPASYRLPR
jgi:GNAT superfamily N-acetyltransferase